MHLRFDPIPLQDTPVSTVGPTVGPTVEPTAGPIVGPTEGPSYLFIIRDWEQWSTVIEHVIHEAPYWTIDLWYCLISWARSMPERKVIVVSVLLLLMCFIVLLIKRIKIF
jgi:hypothetical protein